MKSQALLALFILFFPFYLSAQVLKPISWATSISAESPKIGQEVELLFKATIENDWYLYSSDFDPELGPQVTTFSFEPNKSFALVGEITPVQPKKKYDDLWEGEYTYFIGSGEFKQKVKILEPEFSIQVKVAYQVCTDVTGRCIPLDDEFSFKGKASGSMSKSAAPDQTTTTDFEQNPTSQTLWGFMLYAFLFGLAAIFTPCVFPMIPLTVSFFTKKQGTKGKLEALFYGFSIILIYTLIGAIIAPLAGPAFANVISTHWLPNLIFFAVFVVFALSFFGMFDIVLPNSLVNAMDKKADKGGWLSVFFMAFTLVLVSFSCTGPIVGSILVESAGGAIVKPVAGMFAFALAFALPFTTFAFFPQWLNKMPKSGGWLNSVKVTLGFVELALAFKFLSMIDLVYHWGILDRDVNIAIWIAIFAFMGLYYLGKIRLPHDSPTESISAPRMLLALSCFAFVVYLFPGMFGAPLKMLSGILPPQTHHDFDLNAIIRKNGGTNVTVGNSKPTVKYGNLFEFPHGLQGYFDYEEGMAAAKKLNKPVLIDFTGHGCANCRKMEDNVWIDQRVMQILREKYVIIALYVDDPTKLPENEWVTSSYDGKPKKTIGAINMDFQISRFNNNAQPFYALLDQKGSLLIDPPIGYEPNADRFFEYLETGLNRFQQSQSAKSLVPQVTLPIGK